MISAIKKNIYSLILVIFLVLPGNAQVAKSSSSEKKLEPQEQPGIKTHIATEKKLRMLRDSGLIAWFKYPNSTKKFQWLLQTVRRPPSYWYNLNNGAYARAKGVVYSTPVDWKAIEEWEKKYDNLKKEFLKSKIVKNEDKGRLLVNELYGILTSSLNKERQRNGKLDLKYITDLSLKAAELIGREPKGTRASNLSSLLIDMDMLFLYNTVYGWELDGLQEFVANLSTSNISFIKDWVVKKSALLKLRVEPLNLKFKDLNGSYVHLENLRGKVVLVDFWATNCGVCIDRMEQIKPVYEKLKAKGFEIISVCINKPDSSQKKVVRKIEERIGVNWITALIGSNVGDMERLDHDVFYKFGFFSVPQLMLLDKMGKLVAFNGVLLSGDIEPLINKHLKF